MSGLHRTGSSASIAAPLPASPLPAEEVVRRYLDSPAIWGWELGNEYSLEVDLPNHSQHRPGVHPRMGTPGERSERDELKFVELRTALVAFAETVRRIDATRILLTGNSSPRPAAWHNLHERSWRRDSEEQFAEILCRDNPDPVDTITVHTYHDGNGHYAGGARSIDEAVALSRKVADRVHKPLFLGELGADRRLGPPETQRAVFQEFLRTIEEHDVPLSAFWVFDYAPQEGENNITFRNDRSPLLDLVVEANVRRSRRR